jgi:hypothetical protein
MVRTVLAPLQRATTGGMCVCCVCVRVCVCVCVCGEDRNERPDSYMAFRVKRICCRQDLFSFPYYGNSGVYAHNEGDEIEQNTSLHLCGYVQ